MKRDTQEVTISLGVTALTNLSRFFERGVLCARYHHSKEGWGISTSGENIDMVSRKLKAARREMRLKKAQALIKK